MVPGRDLFWHFPCSIGGGGPCSAIRSGDWKLRSCGISPRSSDGTFLLTSPAVEDGAELPLEFTGDGDGVTPPLG